MPSPADLVGGLLSFVGDALSASSLRLGIGPTLVLLTIALIFLQLVARPLSRWITTDPGGLAGAGRAMALAAEAGTDAVVTLGTGGLARSTDAMARIQTIAALPVLGHVARAAARSGVPVRVLVNDPLAAVVAASVLEAAHERTSTRERAPRSRAVVVGEGRGAATGLVMTARARPTAAFAFGSLREEAALHLEGLRREPAAALSAGSAEISQAPATLLAAGGLVGAELYTAAADLQPDAIERAMVAASNRLIAMVVVVIVVASILAAAGFMNPADLMLGMGRP